MGNVHMCINPSPSPSPNQFPARPIATCSKKCFRDDIQQLVPEVEGAASGVLFPCRCGRRAPLSGPHREHLGCN